MPITRESTLEKFIKDFVEAKTKEKVELKLDDDIFVVPINKTGSVILGMLWANVLQCNFPKDANSYTKKPDELGELLVVVTDSTTFSVNLATGNAVLLL